MAAVDTTAEPKAEDVLVLGRGVSLALAGSDLIVKDREQAKHHRAKLCGIPVGAVPAEFSIPLYNVLWAEVVDDDNNANTSAAANATATATATLTIDYAAPTSKRPFLVPAALRYALPAGEGAVPRAAVDAWVEAALARAYGRAQRRKRARVLVNPRAGPGGADAVWAREVAPLFAAARLRFAAADVTRTARGGEAADICAALDVDAYDVVVACAGDGMPFEVFNGLGRRADARRALRQLAVALVPCGSGNAMSGNLYGSHRPATAALAVVKGVPTPVDLMSVTQHADTTKDGDGDGDGDGGGAATTMTTTRTLSFLSQSVGIIAECDLGTEHLRWLGAARFNVGLLQRIFSKKVYPCDVAVKVEIESKAAIKAHYRRDRQVEDPFERREGGPDGAPGKGGTAGGGGESSASSEPDAGDDGLPPLRFGTVDDKLPEDWESAPYDNMGSFYCGNMAWMAPNANFFAAACPNDGLMDLVTSDGDISALKYLDLMSTVEDGRFFDSPLVAYRKVAAYRLTPRDWQRVGDGGYISVDGERIPFAPFQVEVHRGLGTVLSKSGRYEAPGPLGWEKAE
ncbi:diacylglycerol kinase catalytic domain-containing protein [Xylariaceae sp. FL0804]|nr:diacylglycerol kinase catalytic domain-containing protein [Xylariaceae sp. FL0804]